MQNLHQLLTQLYHYISEACPGRERSEIPANYANSMQFAHNICELHEICTIANPLYSMFQMPDQWQRTP